MFGHNVRVVRADTHEQGSPSEAGLRKADDLPHS